MPGVERYLPGFVPLDPEHARRRLAELLKQARDDPESVRWSIEELEALSAWLALEPAQPDADTRERAARLLADPASEFGSHRAVPDVDPRIVPDLLADTYARWVLARAIGTDGPEAGRGPWSTAAHRAAAHGPVGQDEHKVRALTWLMRHAGSARGFPVGTSCPELGDTLPAAAATALMPLEGVEYASVVIPVGTRGGALLCMLAPARRRYLSEGRWVAA